MVPLQPDIIHCTTEQFVLRGSFTGYQFLIFHSFLYTDIALFFFCSKMRARVIHFLTNKNLGWGGEFLKVKNISYKTHYCEKTVRSKFFIFFDMKVHKCIFKLSARSGLSHGWNKNKSHLVRNYNSTVHFVQINACSTLFFFPTVRFLKSSRDSLDIYLIKGYDKVKQH